MISISRITIRFFAEKPIYISRGTKAGKQLEHQNELKLINKSGIEATEVKWLWTPYVPNGKPLLLMVIQEEGRISRIYLYL
jgi:hypothetical protein